MSDNLLDELFDDDDLDDDDIDKLLAEDLINRNPTDSELQQLLREIDESTLSFRDAFPTPESFHKHIENKLFIVNVMGQDIIVKKQLKEEYEKRLSDGEPDSILKELLSEDEIDDTLNEIFGEE